MGSILFWGFMATLVVIMLWLPIFVCYWIKDIYDNSKEDTTGS